ncbi:MAG: hypothetical protein ABW352_01740 [Polyangiales bacterium]
MEKRLALSLMLTVACSDEGGAEEAATSGLEPSQNVSTLSLADQTTWCRWATELEFARLTPQAQCEPEAVLGTDTQANCEASRNACIADYEATRDEERTSRLDSCGRPEIDADCTVTVAQLDACVNDTLSVYEKLGAGLSCGDRNPDRTGFVEPKSCDGIPSGCFPSG